MQSKPQGAELFERAVLLAQQRAQLLALANNPDAPTHRADPVKGPSTRRQLLLRARKVERIIVGIGELCAMRPVIYTATGSAA